MMRTGFRSEKNSKSQALLLAAYSDDNVSPVEFQKMRDGADNFLKDEAFATLGAEKERQLTAVQRAADTLVEGMQRVAKRAREDLKGQQREMFKRILDQKLTALLVDPVESAGENTPIGDLLVSFDHYAEEWREALADLKADVPAEEQQADQRMQSMTEEAVEYQRAYIVLGYGSSLDRL